MAVRAQKLGQVHALLIGIDRYSAVRSLGGCVNDIEHVTAFLRERLGGRLDERRLLNEDATRDAIAEAVRSHLGAAGPGDTALLWFSGHGSQQPVAPEYWHLEPTGMSQSLVCHDSRQSGVPDLTDKELSALLDRIAGRGAHVAVMLDCCHSGGGTRDPGDGVRGIPAAATAPDSSAYLPELRSVAERALTASTRPEHVALSACQSHERAVELMTGGERRGIFTTSLLEAMRCLGEGATYRDLLLNARSRVEGFRASQTPVLYPAHRDGPADRRFLGGVLSPPAGMTARWSADTWLVDAGRCHGIPATSTDAPVEMAVTGHAARTFRATGVGAGLTTVVPRDWAPDPAVQYPVFLSRAPLPVAHVTVEGDPAACDRARHAIDASPYLRVAGPEDAAPGLRFVLTAAHGDGRDAFRVSRADGSPLIAETTADAAVAKMAHIARWTQIKELGNPWSSLTGAARLEIVAARPGTTVAPRDEPAIVPGDDGAITLTYVRTGDGWRPPEVFVRLRNTTDRRLWCVLLNLTDRYRSHAALFPGGFLAPHAVAAAAEGARIPVVLPAGRPVEPGAMSVDWCKLIVADREVSPTALELPPLADLGTRGPSTAAESLGWRPARDLAAPDSPGDWATTLLPVVTRVPNDRE
ncbi:caspase family protein [Actinomadura bangladeshensis]|uniref:caspase family protein n=1 Tax=Actinomadura bangladeshensis TaxID=453573 RepID=UPI001EF2FD34|nr:caspase family protein [Actinomadura bangladeshensis]